MNGPRRPAPLSRREFLQQADLGFGLLALAYLLQADRASAAPAPPAPGPAVDLRPRPGYFPGTARAVILLLQNGGPSQMDLFDPKPELQKRHGQKHPGPVESFQPG